jgi:erythronate-4-phosphate dehydrogenase
MRIVIDDKIPFIRGVLEPFAEIVYLEGSKIRNEDIREADGLIIRTRTICDESLLRNSKVKFIATATIGYDHIDTDFCFRNGIKWSNAPGSNAQSVAQYISSALIRFSDKKEFSLTGKKIGIVGVGNVGSQVARIAGLLGMEVLLNDPPREETEKKNIFCPIEQICEQADIITFHVPLIREGSHKTYQFLNEDFFSRLKKKPLFINTSRGEIVTAKTLINASNQNHIGGLVIDCWENEPLINRDLLQKTDIATPHIAGYSTDGKANATARSVRSVSNFFGFGIDDWQVPFLPEPSEPVISLSGTENDLTQAILHTYDVLQDDCCLRKNPDLFEALRGNYPLRREFKAYTVSGSYSSVLKELGFRQ